MPSHFHSGAVGGPIVAEPKLHFSAKLFNKGLNPENTAVPEAQTDPNGTKEVFHDSVPMGSTSNGAMTALVESSSTEASPEMSATIRDPTIGKCSYPV